LGLLAGTLVVAYAYNYAATALTGQTHFHLFWLGMLLFMAPAIVRVSAVDVARKERLAIVVAVGLFDYLPKFLRNPSYPLFHDEFAHWRQAETIYNTGQLFQPNPIIGIIRYFPGLHALTVALRDLSGAPTFQVGTVLLALLHVIALIGIFVMAERTLGSAQAAGVAAILYSLNPSFMFFDSQYSYESLAIVFFIWVLVAMVNVQDAVASRSRQVAWSLTGVTIAAACFITHHLTSYVMIATQLFVAVVTVARARRGTESRQNALYMGGLALLLLTAAVAWMVVGGFRTVGYLSPSIVGGVKGLLSIAKHVQHARTLFAGSTTPSYERICAFLAPAIVAAGAALGLWRMRRQRPRSSVALALIAVGLLYFPTVPFILTQGGNEGARRSWAFTYIGLCLLIAPVIPWLLRQVVRRRPRTQGTVAWSVAGLLCIVLVGNVAMDMNEQYRFPGPFVYGSDTRGLTPELTQTVQWFRQTQGINLSVVTDRQAGLVFGGPGLDWTPSPSLGFPVWQLYFSTHTPSPFLLRELQVSDYRYMVIDRRMSRYLPRIGLYFAPDEPQAGTRTSPPPAAAIGKYNRLPWAIKVYATDNLAIFRFNFAALHTLWTPSRVEHTATSTRRRAPATPTNRAT
jgi:hypothetical protein